MKNLNHLKGSQTSTLKIRTTRRTELQDVTEQVRAVVSESNCQSGVCYLYVPHTTAGVLGSRTRSMMKEIPTPTSRPP